MFSLLSNQNLPRINWLVLVSQLLTWAKPIKMTRVRVSGGILEGVTASDGSYEAFYGIPYATVTSRFVASKPNPTWDGVKKAVNNNIECSQIFTANITIGIEDCLILNVYVPNTRTDKLRPVMFYIHGGGFRQLSSSPILHGPDHFVKHDVILVTINYRLDILGFLCLRIKEAPGNVGLKDQVEALKWVNKNIKAFGGDPENVTIFGVSAGAASVTYHLLSPMSQGLFNKAIIKSGSSIGYPFLQYDPIFIAHRLAAQLEQDTDDLQELVKIFQSKSERDLLLTRVPRKIGDQYETEKIFVPCVEKEIPGIESFLTDFPDNLLTAGKYQKVPIVIGFAIEEGYYFTGNENDATIKNLNFYDSLPRDLDFPSIETKKEIAEAVKTLYLPNEPISKKNMAKFSRYVGESTITASVAITISKLLATTDQPVYAYEFFHSGQLNLNKELSGFGHYSGATHGDELFFLFSSYLTPAVLTQRDEDIVRKLATLWTNFAKYSNPTPEVSDVLPLQWLPADQIDPQVYIIDNELTTAPLWNNRLEFWDCIYSKYRRPRNKENALDEY